MGAQQGPVIAIDIALDPDARMTERAEAANARLKACYPEGFAFDATHRPHITLLQQFVGVGDLDKVFAGANAVLSRERPASWKLKALEYDYGASPPIGSASIAIEATDDLRRLQGELLAAVAPYKVKTGTPAAFFSEVGGRDIAEFVLGYVANFAAVAAGVKFSPHVTVGVGRQADFDQLLSAPFEPFSFSAAGAAAYQLGAFGTARELKRLTFAR
jgi:2'-5' RNA ligase